MALVRSDRFWDVGRLFPQLWGGLDDDGTDSLAMPADAYRKDGALLIRFDLPGVRADAVELTVEDNMLTVQAERPAPDTDGMDSVIAERPYGIFSRQVFLGNNLDTEHIEAQYEAGVLTVVIPVVPQGHRIEISEHGQRQQQLSA